ncbi:uncharacterized protein LOC103705760 isoform X2 [Phoenix dactylifera]|uniref:Uncharacterized protein LOC103705760 isoform X2 n=1 Tax=Phoenix dactylifera TaxID=42345 RepID=A0A8B8J3T3_PHODC|nr:uncharacterized protein LOC103705760 isoform X2 [Phoenix dactylifera]
MDLPRFSCPENSFLYNSTLCGCNPGYYKEEGGKGCVLFEMEDGDWAVRMTGVAGAAGPASFLADLLPLDDVRRMVRSEAALLKAVIVTVVFWLAFCAAVRLGRVDGGRTVWFRVRWRISRLDLRFATKHHLDDQMVVRKRKTELGGMFSIASWIFFIGLLSTLLYQVIAKRSIEVRRVRPTNAPDLLLFVNDMEFNITTISSMSCSQLRGLDTLVVGAPGFIGYKVLPLSTYVNYSCYNTSRGPTISLKCNSCQVPRQDHYISWQFVDLPNDPAAAVGFHFNFSAKSHGDDKHASFVSGTLKYASYSNDTPVTFRGRDLNILKIHLFLEKFIYLHDLRLILPLFHDFLPGSSSSEASDLQASLQSSKDGLVNTTLYISYLSDYIVEIDKENVLGIVGFLADVGGLYVISLAIFLYFLLQCESRIKKLQNEDSVMRDVRCKRRAQKHWNKLRKYVMYTWGHSNLNMRSGSSTQHGSSMIDSFRGIGSPHRKKQTSGRDSAYLDKMGNIPDEMNILPESVFTGRNKSRLASRSVKFDEILPCSEGEHEMVGIKEDEKKQQSTSLCMGNQPELNLHKDKKLSYSCPEFITTNEISEISNSS